MEQHISDLVIHIDESLQAEEISRLQNEMHDDAGIVSACISEKDKHLMIVSYDSEQLRSDQVLGSITRRGFHGELVGM